MLAAGLSACVSKTRQNHAAPPLATATPGVRLTDGCAIQSRRAKMEIPPMNDLAQHLDHPAAARIADLDWPRITAGLDADGYAVTGPLLTRAECDSLSAGFDADTTFRNRVVMALHGYGQGEYRYYAYPAAGTDRRPADRTLSGSRGRRQPVGDRAWPSTRVPAPSRGVP